MGEITAHRRGKDKRPQCQGRIEWLYQFHRDGPPPMGDDPEAEPNPEPEVKIPMHRTDRGRCPCGFEGSRGQIAAHRQGIKTRPQCQGPIDWHYRFHRDGPPPAPPEPDVPPTASQPNSTPNLATPELPNDEMGGNGGAYDVDEALNAAIPYEWPGGAAAPADPEALAAEMLRRRREVRGDGGNGHGGAVDLGEFSLDPFIGPPHISAEKISVQLPVSILVMYDYAKNEGWNVGDGSLAAFITDCLLDHFHNCWGKAIVVVDREEVGIVD